MESCSVTVEFRIPGATEPDAYAVRAYESELLDDILLSGPDEQSVFAADFDRQADSASELLEAAIADLTAVFPEAEILRAAPSDDLTASPGS